MNYSVDCRLISPESKFKFVEGLDRDQSILVRDLEVPADCRFMDRPDVAVCGVIKAK